MTIRRADLQNPALDEQISAIDGQWKDYDASAAEDEAFIRQKIAEAQQQYNKDPYKYSGEEINSAAQGLKLDQLERGRDAILSDKQQTEEKLREAVASGKGMDAARQELLDHGVDTKEVNNQTRDAIKAAYQEGTLSASTVQTALVKYSLSDDSDAAYWLVQKWDYANETGDSEGYGKYDNFIESIPKGGSSMEKYAKELLDHGVAVKTAAGQITDTYKAQYLALKESDPSATKDMLEWLYNAYEALGYAREYEYSHYIKNWK